MAEMKRNQLCPCGSGKKYKKCCLPGLQSGEMTRKIIDLMENNRFQEAEKLALRILKHHDSMDLRNFLAITKLHQGDARGTVHYLEPCLQARAEADLGDRISTTSMAALALAQIGEQQRAYEFLQETEELFSRGLEHLYGSEADQHELSLWKEQSLIITKTAATLNDHQRVYDFYHRWEAEGLGWQTTFKAAVACFNLGFYDQAASIWAQLAPQMPICHFFANIAVLTGQNAIPPFILDYEPKARREVLSMVEKMEDEASRLRWLLEDTGYRLVLLSAALPTGQDMVITDAARETLQLVVRWGGAWGVDLGFRLLKSDIPIELKKAAARGLMEEGSLDPDQPVPMVIDGEETELDIWQVPVLFELDERAEQSLAEARQLQAAGRLREAAETLEDTLDRGAFFPKVALKLSRILGLMHEFEDACYFQQLLEEITPHDPAVRLNRVELLAGQGHLAEAHRLLQEIDQKDAESNLRKRIETLKLYIKSKRSQAWLRHELDALVTNRVKESRRNIQEKPLNPHPSLARALKNLPADWITTMANYMKKEPAPRRPERTRQVMEVLTNPVLLGAWINLMFGEQEQELLRYLLHREGWARLAAVTRKFGSMEEDVFSITEGGLPSSPLGRLWNLGLVGIGRANLGKRYERIVTIPLDLRPPLAEVLLGPDYGDAESGTFEFFAQAEQDKPERK